MMLFITETCRSHLTHPAFPFELSLAPLVADVLTPRRRTDWIRDTSGMTASGHSDGLLAISKP